MDNSLSLDSKINLTLDELSYIYNLEDTSKEHYFLKHSYSDLEKYAKSLYNSLYNKQSHQKKNDMDIIQIDNWKFNKTHLNNEYVSGYVYDYHKFWETSNITHKINITDGLLIITESEHIYYLPFRSFSECN